MPRRGPIRGNACRPVKDAKGQNLLNTANGFAATLDAIIRLPVKRQALLVQSTKTGFVAEERPVSHQYTPLQQEFDSAIEPHHGDTTTRGSRSDAQPSTRVRQSCSMSRKTGSPFCSKICAIGKPVWRSITESRSTKCQASWAASMRPTVLLPEPMKPVRQTMRHSGAGPVSDFFGWE